MNTPYTALFQASHKEQLLSPIPDLVKQARSERITIWALDTFAPAHVAVLNTTSCCAVVESNVLPIRTIIMNNSQIHEFTKGCEMDFAKCFELVFLHEQGHIDLLDRRGVVAASSEFDAWEFVAPRTSATRADYENLRGHCMWNNNPRLLPPVDTTPQFWKDFLRMGSQIGYPMAWAGCKADIKRLNLQPWDVLRILQEDCELPFDIAYPLSEGEDIDYALLRLAVLNKDYKALDKLVTLKPTNQLRRVPEQPIV